MFEDIFVTMLGNSCWHWWEEAKDTARYPVPHRPSATQSASLEAPPGLKAAAGEVLLTLFSCELLL